MKKVGAYLPGAYEEVVDVVKATVLTEKVWLTKFCSRVLFFHIRALHRMKVFCDLTQKQG